MNDQEDWLKELRRRGWLGMGGLIEFVVGWIIIIAVLAAIGVAWPGVFGLTDWLRDVFWSIG